MVILGVVILVRLNYTLATQGYYSRQLVEYSLCQLQGNRPDCNVEAIVNNISVMSNILTSIAMGALPFMNMIFPARWSDFVKMANILCWVCRQRRSCSSAVVQGKARVQNDAMGKSPQENLN